MRNFPYSSFQCLIIFHLYKPSSSQGYSSNLVMPQLLLMVFGNFYWLDIIVISSIYIPCKKILNLKCSKIIFITFLHNNLTKCLQILNITSCMHNIKVNEATNMWMDFGKHTFWAQGKIVEKLNWKFWAVFF